MDFREFVQNEYEYVEIYSCSTALSAAVSVTSSALRWTMSEYQKKVSLISTISLRRLRAPGKIVVRLLPRNSAISKEVSRHTKELFYRLVHLSLQSTWSCTTPEARMAEIQTALGIPALPVCSIKSVWLRERPLEKDTPSKSGG